MSERLASEVIARGGPVPGSQQETGSAASDLEQRADAVQIAAPVAQEPVPDPRDLAQLLAFVRAHAPLCVLTGAELSAASGIPTYRDAAGSWRRSTPVQAAAFLRSARTRQRYWLRSLYGWPAFAAALPNAGHFALAALEAAGTLTGVITQNVDGLHQRAGSHQVIDLHGRLDNVRCMACAALYPRADILSRLQNLNAGLLTLHSEPLADGDAALPGETTDALLAAVRVPVCSLCGGLLKPTVTFFGDSIAPTVWAAADASMARARGLLVVGSSLSVYSGLRMCRRAHAAKVPIVAVNRGWTRADALLQAKVDSDAAATLVALLAALAGASQGGAACK